MNTNHLVWVLILLFSAPAAADPIAWITPDALINRAPINTNFTNEERLNASPFDPIIQKRVFYAVAKIMRIKKLDPHIARPRVIVNHKIPVNKIPEYLGFALNTNAIYYFSYLKNTILLGEEAKLHQLVHEMVHYFQFHYHLDGDISRLSMDPEPLAVRIQNKFRPQKEQLQGFFSNAGPLLAILGRRGDAGHPNRT